MSTETFIPTIYSKHGCPYCFKLRLFLRETDQLDRVIIVEGSDDVEHKKLAEFLSEKVGKASFPTAEIARGIYLPESDDLVAHFAALAGVSPLDYPTYQAFAAGVLPGLQAFYREFVALKKQLG